MNLHMLPQLKNMVWMCTDERGLPDIQHLTTSLASLCSCIIGQV